MKHLLNVMILLFVGAIAFAQSPAPAAKGVTYGAGTTNENTITVTEMEQKFTAQDKFEGKVVGKVVEVCQEKGCWMKVDKGNGETLMVKFKNYGFFMPKNIVGQTVVLDGEAVVKEVSVKQQKHYAEDAGKNKEEIEKIKEPKKETQFIARGVLVL
ncbi:MAG: DUF4920 domain-containing protein [Chitinophagaceae bacterium]|nr:DUF4920 domain-containing protein [Chitinophagaceae bacterium]